MTSIRIRDNRLPLQVSITLKKLKTLGYDRARQSYLVSRDILSANDLSVDDLRGMLNTCLSDAAGDNRTEQGSSTTILSLIYQGIDMQNIRFSLSVNLDD